MPLFHFHTSSCSHCNLVGLLTANGINRLKERLSRKFKIDQSEALLVDVPGRQKVTDKGKDVQTDTSIRREDSCSHFGHRKGEFKCMAGIEDFELAPDGSTVPTNVQSLSDATDGDTCFEARNFGPKDDRTHRRE